MHCIRRPLSLALWMAGSNKAISVPMIAITTRSSTSVKPVRSVIVAAWALSTCLQFQRGSWPSLFAKFT